MNKAVSDPDARQVLIETLVVEKLKTECKKVIRLLKAQTLSMAEWIKDMTNIGSNVYHANITGKARAKSL